jgi:hypothetical protein
MATIRIVEEQALSGSDLEGARHAALASLRKDGLSTASVFAAARNDFFTAKEWAARHPSHTGVKCPPT